MVAKVSGGSWELLGWSLSGGSPPMIEGQRLFRNVTHAWMKGSWMGGKHMLKRNPSKRVWCQQTRRTYPVFSDLVRQPFIKLEVFTARGESSEVNHKGKGGSVEQHGEGLQGQNRQRERELSPLQVL